MRLRPTECELHYCNSGKGPVRRILWSTRLYGVTSPWSQDLGANYLAATSVRASGTWWTAWPSTDGCSVSLSTDSREACFHCAGGLSQDGRSPGWGSNLAPPEYKWTALPLCQPARFHNLHQAGTTRWTQLDNGANNAQLSQLWGTRLLFRGEFRASYHNVGGHAVAQLVEALWYKPGGGGVADSIPHEVIRFFQLT
jgi:hypothetical protein